MTTTKCSPRKWVCDSVLQRNLDERHSVAPTCSGQEKKSRGGKCHFVGWLPLAADETTANCRRFVPCRWRNNCQLLAGCPLPLTKDCHLPALCPFPRTKQLPFTGGLLLAADETTAICRRVAPRRWPKDCHLPAGCLSPLTKGKELTFSGGLPLAADQRTWRPAHWRGWGCPMTFWHSADGHPYAKKWKWIRNPIGPGKRTTIVKPLPVIFILHLKNLQCAEEGIEPRSSNV